MSGTALKVLLAGDVMTGRGIDQILSHASSPVLYESWARSAMDYVDLAEAVSGTIPRGVGDEYVWGDALEILKKADIDARVINLETAVTTCGIPWPSKGINYRMHPRNIGVLVSGGIDCCVLANNHILDWSRPGLEETIETLQAAGVATTGAGTDAAIANRPAALETTPGHRIVVIGVGTGDSGIPGDWAAGGERSGVALLRSLDTSAVEEIAARVTGFAGPADPVIVSIHWGGNWGYPIPPEHRRFAHALIEDAGVHVIHGHSSHHPLAIEVHRKGLILYGCGDLINDYEGIAGHDAFRPDVGMLYEVIWQPEDGLRDLRIIPFRRRRFRLERVSGEESDWLRDRLTGEGRHFGTSLETDTEGDLVLRW